MHSVYMAVAELIEVCAAMSFKTVWMKYYDFIAPFPTSKKKHVLALSDNVGIAPDLWTKQQKMRMRVRLSQGTCWGQYSSLIDVSL